MRPIATVACFAVLLSGASITAAAGHEAPALEESTSVGVGEALFEENSYALEFNVSTEEAHRRLSLQDSLDRYLSEVELRFPTQYGGGWITHSPAYGLEITFVRGAEDTLRALAEIAPPEVTIKVSYGRAMSLEELIEQRDEVAEQLLKYDSVTVDVDVKTGTLVLEGTARTEQLAAMRSELATSAQVELRHKPTSPADLTDNIYGGMPMSQCTSGFTIHKNTFGDGVMTAAHCSNDQYIYLDDGTFGANLEFGGEYLGAKRDVQLHYQQSGLTEVAQFQSNDGNYRPVQGQKNRADQQIGDYVCHRGRTTGYSCGSIVSKTYQPTYPDACGDVTCEAKWIRVEGPNLECYGGDSGGPWFLTYTAFGLLKGGSTTGVGPGDCAMAFYMAINFVNDYPGPNVDLLFM